MVYYNEKFDTKEAAETFIEDMLQSYHPLGYGTSFKEPKEVEPGVWQVIGSRGSSAD